MSGEQEVEKWSVDEFKTLGEHVYDGMHWPAMFSASSLERMKSYDFRDDDIIIATYPKAGTTWMMEILWLVMHDGDIEGSKATDVNRRVPMLEFVHGDINVMDLIDQLPAPRLFKTHAHKHVFEHALKQKKAKVIVVMRDLKDSLVSYYHFYRSNPGLGSFPGTFEQFVELFRQKRLVAGDWFDFNLSWWEEAANANVMIITYEQMSKDRRKIVQQVADFVGKTLTSETLDIICENVSFGKMKSNPGVTSQHTRKGAVGDWRNHFSPQLEEEINELYETKLGNSTLKTMFKD